MNNLDINKISNGSEFGKMKINLKEISIKCETVEQYRKVFEFYKKKGFELEPYLEQKINNEAVYHCFNYYPFLQFINSRFGCNSSPKWSVITFKEFIKGKIKESKWKSVWKGN